MGGALQLDCFTVYFPSSLHSPLCESGHSLSLLKKGGGGSTVREREEVGDAITEL